jgi:prepilin-type N-terminal cleavage/methylation domain-containing protein
MRRAFTLIELLVVIAIISLLIGLVIPMLRRAKEIAQENICGGFLKEIGRASHTYAGEHQGRFPGRCRSSV